MKSGKIVLKIFTKMGYNGERITFILIYPLESGDIVGPIVRKKTPAKI